MITPEIRIKHIAEKLRRADIYSDNMRVKERMIQARDDQLDKLEEKLKDRRKENEGELIQLTTSIEAKDKEIQNLKD